MSRKIVAVALTVVLAWAVPARADVLTVDLSSPSGGLGPVQTYSVNGVKITARGYSTPGGPFDAGTAMNLFGKTEGGDETGLGLADSFANELNAGTGQFIQLDFGKLFKKMDVAGAQISMGSVSSDEAFNLYGSNKKGVEGDLLLSNVSLDQVFFDLPELGKYRFYSVDSSSGNVLLTGLTVQASPKVVDPVPEPATLALLGVGLGGLAAWGKRSRRAAV